MGGSSSKKKPEEEFERNNEPEKPLNDNPEGSSSELRHINQNQLREENTQFKNFEGGREEEFNRTGGGVTKIEEFFRILQEEPDNQLNKLCKFIS